MNACVCVFLIGQIVSMQMGHRSVRPRGRKSKALGGADARACRVLSKVPSPVLAAHLSYYLCTFLSLSLDLSHIDRHYLSFSLSRGLG